jgi:hypothetical protein
MTPYKVRKLTKSKGFESKSRVTIKYESPNRYYLLIPFTFSKNKRSSGKESVIALDPCFKTCFTTKRHFVEYGK